MRLHGLCIALALALVAACFVDAGPGAGGSGEGTTGSAETGSVTTGSAETGSVETGSVTTGSVETGSVTTAGTTGVATSGSTGDPGVGTTSGGTSTGEETTGPPPMEPCDAYYASEFDVAPGGDWHVITPTWDWSQGVYRGASTNGLSAVTRFFGGPWSDVRVVARLRLLGSSVGGVLLRLGDPLMKQYLYVRLDATSGNLEVWVADTKQLSIGPAVSADTWHELDVSLVGTTLSFALDGKNLANGVQIVGLAGGTVGLLAQTGKVEVDAISVCPPK